MQLADTRLNREYPVASERGGSPDDFANFPSFLRNLRAAMNGSGYKFGLSITLVSRFHQPPTSFFVLPTYQPQPSSYWYLRGFDIVAIDPIVDFLNIMTYDLHGTWDGTDPYIGAVALAHTNLTEIQQSLDLLWRNNINPSKVNLGIGFYGRSKSSFSTSGLKQLTSLVQASR
jgi:chitinase